MRYRPNLKETVLGLSQCVYQHWLNRFSTRTLVWKLSTPGFRSPADSQENSLAQEREENKCFLRRNLWNMIELTHGKGTFMWRDWTQPSLFLWKIALYHRNIARSSGNAIWQIWRPCNFFLDLVLSVTNAHKASASWVEHNWLTQNEDRKVVEAKIMKKKTLYGHSSEHSYFLSLHDF